MTLLHHQPIMSASSVHHERIISASSAHHQRIISASSAHHQCIISASSVHHQCNIIASLQEHQRIIMTYLAHHKGVLDFRLELRYLWSLNWTILETFCIFIDGFRNLHGNLPVFLRYLPFKGTASYLVDKSTN